MMVDDLSRYNHNPLIYSVSNTFDEIIEGCLSTCQEFKASLGMCLSSGIKKVGSSSSTFLVRQ